jgi:hypothetical protein
MGPYTLSFAEVDQTRLPDVGGKGANLGELTRAGFPVPPGFCVTTAAYRDFVRQSGDLDALLDALDGATHQEPGAIGALGGRVRERLGALAMPAGVRSAALAAWRELGAGRAYAVRSSATAEDLPSASFAGQQSGVGLRLSTTCMMAGKPQRRRAISLRRLPGDVSRVSPYRLGNTGQGTPGKAGARCISTRRVGREALEQRKERDPEADGQSEQRLQPGVVRPPLFEVLNGVLRHARQAVEIAAAQARPAPQRLEPAAKSPLVTASTGHLDLAVLAGKWSCRPPSPSPIIPPMVPRPRTGRK